MEAVLDQGRTPMTGRGRDLVEVVAPLHGEKEVVEGPEMKVYSQIRQEGGCQPLPDKVPREQRELELDSRKRLISHPVPVNVGGLCGSRKTVSTLGRAVASSRRS
jgi:hypothetical protein